MTTDDLAARFEEQRAHLLGVGYRLTSSLADAEDAVQEAWLRLSTKASSSASSVSLPEHAAITDLRAWLTTVVGRICLDRLRSAAVRRESYQGSWLPEPLLAPTTGGRATDPAEVVARDDGVRMAALVVLDRLTAEQRVAFVLHDAFGVPFSEIADILACTTTTARQHASRARRAVEDADPPPRAELTEQQELLNRFLEALATGDVDGMVSLLRPDAAYIGDGGGEVRTALRPVIGAEKVARLLLGLRTRYGPGLLAGSAVLVNGDLGIHIPTAPASRDYPPMDEHVATFSIVDGRIAACYDIAAPGKLAAATRSRTATRPEAEPGTRHPR